MMRYMVMLIQNSEVDSVILQIDNLTKRFGGVVALNEVCFDLAAGEVHAICGENGAGKSTLIKVLSGVHPAGSYQGTVTLYNEPAEFHSISDAEKAGIAVIYQELAMVREMTVAENIFLGAEPTIGGLIDWSGLYHQTGELLGRFGIALDPAAVVKDLGIGQQQLVEIAKALSKKSKILLLDEPTAALTESEVDILFNIIRDMKKQGIACIYISHKLDEIFAISDRITILRDGHTAATLETGQTDKNEVIGHMVGREIGDMFPRRLDEAKVGDVLFKVDGLTVAGPERSKPVLEDISFELVAGEVLGLGGLMGAGRTELLMHLFGVYGRRIQGEIFLNGRELREVSPAQAIRLGMVLVSEDRRRYGLIMEQDIGFNLSLASLKRFSRCGLIDRNFEVKRNRQLFEALDIRASHLEVPLEELSGGNLQKVVLGKALMTEPSVVFLDEPTRGIDVGAKVEVYEIINTLTEQGKAVVIVSSELPELIGMSDRIVILSEGRIGGKFTREEYSQEAILSAAMANH